MVVIFIRNQLFVLKECLELLLPLFVIFWLGLFCYQSWIELKLFGIHVLDACKQPTFIKELFLFVFDPFFCINKKNCFRF